MRNLDDAELDVPIRNPILPWIISGIAVLAALGVCLWQAQRLDAERAKSVAATIATAEARARWSEADKARRALEARVQQLESEREHQHALAIAAALPAGPLQHKAAGVKKAARGRRRKKS